MNIISRHLANNGSVRKEEPVLVTGYDNENGKILEEVADVLLMHKEGEAHVKACKRNAGKTSSMQWQ